MTARKLSVVVGGKGKDGDTAPPGGGGGGGASAGSDWRDLLTRTKDLAVKCTTHNLLTILTHDQHLSGLFAFDEFSNRVTLRRDPPWEGYSGEFTELDAVELAGFLGVRGSYELAPKTGQVIEVVETIARRHRYHPVREYLDALRWDGKPRLDDLFVDYFGAESSDFTRLAGRIFMLSAVARIRVPGCKVDSMLVLEGAQGVKKTSAVRLLFGGDAWYVDINRSPGDKDFYQDLVGKWGVEIGEMASFTKADYNRVKQALSAQADTYRPSYGRYSRTFPRQCVFIGTTNDLDWQRDPTGGRRYLPVYANAVLFAELERDRDQLWAEAVKRFDDGERYWLERGEGEEEQEARFQTDSWEDPIQRWVAGRMHGDKYPGHEFTGRETAEVQRLGVPWCTSTMLLMYALGIELGRHDKPSQMRVAAIMRRLGWTAERGEKNGTRVRYWKPPPKPPKPAADSGADDGLVTF